MAVKDEDKEDKSSKDRALWREVTRDVKTLGPHETQPPAPPVKRLRIRPSDPVLPPLPASLKNAAPPGHTDRRTESKMRKGEITIDGRIDLHGLRVAQAQAELQRFILQAISSGKRCLLVITGKGTSAGSGSIRREFRLWLEDSTIRPYILSVSQAVPKHGGEGAWYIYLRRIRN